MHPLRDNTRIWGRESPNFVIGAQGTPLPRRPAVPAASPNEENKNLIDTAKIEAIANAALEGSKLFLVSVTATPTNEIEVVIDSDDSVDIDDCVNLSQTIEAQFDREAEDFELTVTSAGVGQPLKLLRQYRKLIGQPVEVLLQNGTKIIAELRDATEEGITLAYEEMRAVEGKKRKQPFDVVQTWPMEEIKYTKEYLDFK